MTEYFGVISVCKIMKDNITELLNESNGKYINQEIYESLVKIAKYSLRYSSSHSTLRTSDVVNEAVIKIYKKHENEFNSRGHFFALMSQIMRNIVIDYARKKQALKNGGKFFHVTLSRIDEYNEQTDFNLNKMLDIESAISNLGKMDHALEEMIVMRFYGGLSVSLIAEYFNISESTVKRQLRFSQAFLKSKLAG